MRHIKEYNQLFENTQELTQEQKDWLDSCTDGTWQINPQTGEVDVIGNFDCEDPELRDFKGVRFGVIGESFWCQGSQLTTLEGAPREVGDDFACNDSQLVSLKGGPQKVGGDFDCSGNQLTSLEGAPRSVGGYFSCEENQLTSLEGAPQSVGNSFYCGYNKLTSLEGAPQKVGGYFYCGRNSLISLEGAPQNVGLGFSCSNNPISEETIYGVLKMVSDKGITLEQAVSDLWKDIPGKDKPYLAKHNPDLSPEEKRGYAALERMKTRVI